MSRVVIVAPGRGGPPQEPVDVDTEAATRRTLVGGDLAHMTLAALLGGAPTVAAIRVNAAAPATLAFRDMTLEARNAGQIGNATLVERHLHGGRHTIRLRNVVLGVREAHANLPDARAVIASLNAGELVRAQPEPDHEAPEDAPHGLFLGQGVEGPPLQHSDWRGALDAARDVPDAAALVVGSCDDESLVYAQQVAADLDTPLLAGPDYFQTKAEVMSAAERLAAAAPGAMVVCNTVVMLDMQTERPQEYASTHLAAFVAGALAGGAGWPVRVTLPNLSYVFSDEDVARLEASGVVAARYDQAAEAFLVSRADS